MHRYFAVVVHLGSQIHVHAYIDESELRIHQRVDAHAADARLDRKSTRLNSSHRCISYAVFCLEKNYSRMCSSSTPITEGGTAANTARRVVTCGQKSQAHADRSCKVRVLFHLY